MATQTYEGYAFVQQFLDAYPEIKQIVAEAEANGWTTVRFEQAIRGSQWYRSRNEAQRQWDMEERQDPAAAAQRVKDTELKVRSLASLSGLTLTDAQVAQLAKAMYRDGADDLAVRVALSRFIPSPGAEQGVPTTPGTKEEGLPTGGTVGQSITDLRRMAQEYGVPVSSNRLREWARDILAGSQTVDGLRGYFQTAAKSLFPEFSTQLDAGLTTRDMLDPYLQIAQSTLEVDEDQINLADPKWVPTVASPEGNRVMTLQEWQQKIRSDPQYGFAKTGSARDEAYAMTARLGRLFGNY